MSRNKISYEWDNEFVDRHGDIEDHHHGDTLEYLEPPQTIPDANGYTRELVLVRDVWNDWDGVVDRQWAYVEDGVLPTEFTYGAKVPKRFHVEYNRWIKKQAKA
ncbi:MAG: hypothetical protein ACO22U_11180 [bacterium]